MDVFPVVALAEDEGAACLSAVERAACECLPEHRRADWRAGRLAAKRAAAAALGAARPERLVLLASHPRPYVCDEGGAPVPLSLSLSHRDGRAAAAADAAGRGVGVDLERAGAVRAGQERLFLTPAERSRSPFSDPTALWALKEAAWKALGCDARTPFTALELGFDSDARLAAVSLHGRSRPARAELSSPWPGYLLAVLRLEEA